MDCCVTSSVDRIVHKDCLFMFVKLVWLLLILPFLLYVILKCPSKVINIDSIVRLCAICSEQYDKWKELTKVESKCDYIPKAITMLDRWY